jgi:hypothetical protein
MPKQSWQMQNEPALIVEDPAEVVVFLDKEVKRFRAGAGQEHDAEGMDGSAQIGGVNYDT